ncbi:MAG: response regulator, partial [Burkholderiales bacterium]
AAQREVMRSTLETRGCVVDAAGDGRAALQRLRAAAPDLIVLDLMMPEMDGFELAAALQDDPSWRRIPVVVVTAKDLTATDRKRLETGVNRVLLKHELDPAALIEQIRAALATAQRAPAAH